MMKIQRQKQLQPVNDDVLALTSVIRPILEGILYALKKDVVEEAGGLSKVKLKMLPRLYRPGDGDVGVCFEYAVHSSMLNNDPRVHERVADALKLCRINPIEMKSILLGFEKKGSVNLIDTANDILTDESRTLPGNAGQPPRLKPRLNLLSAAFKRAGERNALPYSIRGLWKADLFLGSLNSQQWVGTSVKINPNQLEGAAGLRIGIIPTKQGKSDRVYLDDNKKLVICPLHHDGDFMQIFYEGWRIVQAFIISDAWLPKEALLPRPVDREICRILEDRREYPAIDVIDALSAFGQPELLDTVSEDVGLEEIKGDSDTRTIIAPLSRELI